MKTYAADVTNGLLGYTYVRKARGLRGCCWPAGLIKRVWKKRKTTYEKVPGVMLACGQTAKQAKSHSDTLPKDDLELAQRPSYRKRPASGREKGSTRLLQLNPLQACLEA